MRATITLSLAIVAVCYAGAAFADLRTPNSTYRAVKDGVGNCIFSTGDLPFDKEASYRDVKTSFGTGDVPVQIRCYYPKQLKEYVPLGRFWNQIRDEGVWNNLFTIESKGGRLQFDRVGEYRPTSESLEWDQMRMMIEHPGGRCNFKDDSKLGKDGCVDIDKQVRALAAAEGAALPYTAKVCISMTVKWADNFKERYDDFREAWVKEKTDLRMDYVALSCVEYTAK